MKNQTIHYDLRVDVSYSCKMDFNDYPFDVHECPFRVSSYYSSKETVACTSVYEADKRSDRIPQYWITIEELPSRLNTTMYFETEYATCGFNLVLVRSKQYIASIASISDNHIIGNSFMGIIYNPSRNCAWENGITGHYFSCPHQHFYWSKKYGTSFEQPQRK